MKNNPIPGDQPIWLSFVEVYEHNLLVLRHILENAAANDPGAAPSRKKLATSMPHAWMKPPSTRPARPH
jgi:hypothetical protein